MLPIAGQTPGPIGLKFMGGWGVLKAKKFNFISTGSAGPFG